MIRPFEKIETKLNIRVGKQIGTGSYGKVYRAVNLNLGNLCALKIIEAPHSLSEDEEKEYRVSARENL